MEMKHDRHDKEQIQRKGMQYFSVRRPYGKIVS
jgi:hypothetical protein